MRILKNIILIFITMVRKLILEIDENVSTWVLDPIDGTRNYVYQYPHYALSLACFSEGKVICAVIIDPCRDDVFCAGEGTGALLNNKRIDAIKTKLTTLNVGKCWAFVK